MALISIQNIDMSLNLSEETQREIIKGAKMGLEPFGLVVSMIADQLAYVRLYNLVSIADKAKKILEGRELKPKAVERKFLSRFIEEASFEDDPDLQEMWANLLASESQSGQKSFYINILKELDADDAQLLKKIYQKLNYDPNENLKTLYLKHTPDSFFGAELIDIESLKNHQSNYLLLVLHNGSELSDRDERRIRSFQKLESLRLTEINSYCGPIHNSNGDGYVFWAKSNFLGQDFVKACVEISEA